METNLLMSGTTKDWVLSDAKSEAIVVVFSVPGGV